MSGDTKLFRVAARVQGNLDDAKNGLAANIANIQADIVNMKERYFCAVRQNNPQTIPGTGFTTLTYDTEESDEHGMWALATPTRINILVSGVYAIGLTVYLSVSSVGGRLAEVVTNTGQRLCTDWRPTNPASSTIISTSTQAYLEAGMYLQARVTQNSGGDLTSSPTSGISRFSVALLCRTAVINITGAKEDYITGDPDTESNAIIAIDPTSDELNDNPAAPNSFGIMADAE